jgi:small subunit ribosomal protein S19e
MVAVKEVPTHELLDHVALKLEKMKEMEKPPWAEQVKTGPQAERPPEDPKWWYLRQASLLRKIYLQGPIGTNKLRDWYGGKKRRGVKPEKHSKSGGKVIRTCMQQLEQAGFVKKVEKKGRIITPKGQSLLEKTASEVSTKDDKK